MKQSVVFGNFIRALRLKIGMTARDVAEQADWLPSNFSKLEHGVLLPPKDHVKLKRLAEALCIVEGSDDSHSFFDLAAKTADTVPADLADIISRNQALPLLLRMVGNKRLTAKEIERLVEIVRGTKGVHATSAIV